MKAPKNAAYQEATPYLLSLEPAEPEIGGEAERAEQTLEWYGLFSHLQARLQMLRNWRLPWWEHWGLLATYILPRRYHWLITPNQMTRGLPINTEIIDPTGTQAMRICAAGLMSGLTSPSRPWFKLKPQGTFELDEAGQLWFEEVESRIYSVMGSSNFYDSFSQMDEDLVTFGTAPVIIYEDEKDVIRCFNPCAGEYYLAVGPAFRVESFFRTFTYTVAQIVEFFGLDNCPADIRGLWQTKGAALESERIVAHAIEPNFSVPWALDSEGVGQIAGDFTYREVYWVFGMQTECPLSLVGFNDQPFIAPRWATTSNDAYGRSPAMDALPDIMQLQKETKAKAQAIEKQVNPPLIADVSLKNEPSSTLPGNVTYVAQLDNGKGMRPIYQVEPHLDYMTADLQMIQERIKKGFFNDLFLMIAETDKDMTAFEVARRQEEKLQVLGPVIERMQNEALGPAIKRIARIMQRKNMLPPKPPSLQSVNMEIEYISMLSLAQKAAATAGIERLLAMGAKMAEADPTVLDNIDLDATIREYADDLIVPHKLLRNKQDIAERRAERQKQQAAMQQQEAMAQAAPAGKQIASGAKDLSQTDVGGGLNALQLMLQGIGNQPPPTTSLQ